MDAASLSLKLVLPFTFLAASLYSASSQRAFHFPIRAFVVVAIPQEMLQSSSYTMGISVRGKDLIEKYGAPCPDAMVEAALRAATTLDDHNFEDYAFSVKASELNLCVSAYEQLAKKTDAPLHLGITEAGGLTGGTVLSSIGISWLLKQGIGDTLRVSLAADPVEEIKVGWAILKSMHLRTRGVEIVACPTCGRRGIDVVSTVAELEKRLSDIKETLKIAVMGCVVNGPGEALHADIAVCGAANDRCLVYEDGQMMGKIPCSEAVDLIEKRVRTRLDK